MNELNLERGDIVRVNQNGEAIDVIQNIVLPFSLLLLPVEMDRRKCVDYATKLTAKAILLKMEGKYDAREVTKFGHSLIKEYIND